MSSDAARRRVDVAIAEFTALRAEMLDRRGSQKNLAGLALAAFAALFTFSLGRDGDERVLLLVPPLGLVLCILHLTESFHIYRLNQYIRRKLWPELQQETGYPISWQSGFPKRSGPGGLIATILSDGMIPLLLAGSGFAATVPYDQAGGFRGLAWLEIVEYGLVAMTVAAAIAFGVYVAWAEERGTQ
jgi:hypothetical protein